MAWVRIDDNFPEHPKWGNASAFAVQWFVFALCYCNRNLTDGFVPAGVAARMIPTDETLPVEATPFRVIRELELFGVVKAEARGGVDGYLIHDYLKYQPSKRDVEREKKAAKVRKAKWVAEHKKNGQRTPGEHERNGVLN